MRKAYVNSKELMQMQISLFRWLSQYEDEGLINDEKRTAYLERYGITVKCTSLKSLEVYVNEILDCSGYAG